jgi:broad specificity phosphatase PhoE
MASDIEDLQAKVSSVVYVVRHGRTGLNAAGVLRGRLDPPLDHVGGAEAAALGELFHGVALVAVVASPLRRARQTAQPIADATGAPLRGDEGLVDRDYGPWAGRPTAELVARFGSIEAVPGVEPPGAFAARVSTAIAALADRWAPGPLVVVAHDAVNRYALAKLVPGLGDPEHIPQRTGCWNRLERLGSAWCAPVVDAVPDDRHRL